VLPIRFSQGLAERERGLSIGLHRDRLGDVMSVLDVLIFRT
jgi:hypothetical protein